MWALYVVHSIIRCFALLWLQYALGTDTEAILSWFGQCLSCVSTLYHADRDIVLPFLSVRLSVRHVVLLCVNECICPQNVLTVWHGIFLVYFYPHRRYITPRRTLSAGFHTRGICEYIHNYLHRMGHRQLPTLRAAMGHRQ